MSIELSLRNIGLGGREARVYLALLKLGMARVTEIAEESKYERTYCYAILKNLVEIGLIIKDEPEGKVAKYWAKPPETIELIARNQLKEIKKVMPMVKSLYKSNEPMPQIKYYRGKDGVLELYKEAKTIKTSIAFGIVNPTLAYEKIGSNFYRMIEEAVKSGIKLKDLIVSGERAEEYKNKKKEWGEPQTRYLVKNVKLDTDFLIWDDKVALISFEEPIHGYLIQSETIADAWKQIYKILWSLSK